MKTMTTPDFTATVVVDQTPNEAFDAIANVGAWWAKSFKGNAKNENDVFSVTFGETFVNFKITEAVPGKKVVWLVSDCNLHWLTDKKEWRDTQVVWDIARVGNTTKIVMTHVGLVPESECYDDCSVGWTGHIKSSLYKLLSEGVGQPE
ncbi:MAG: hypothetical protein JWQ66_207 [Mucilaginibacter sp.]|nr:hypothetical protein [Mucilaginibacter sp.]